MKIPDLIKETRQKLGEKQKEFAARFGMTATAVSLWESGDREAGYNVIEFCLSIQNGYQVCPTCNGKGYLIK